MDTDKIKRIFPFLKDVDLDDPAKRKALVGISLGGAALMLLLVVIIVFNGLGGPSSGPVSPQRERVLLDTPQGEDTDILGVTDRLSALDRLKGAGKDVRPNYGEELFTRDGTDPRMLVSDTLSARDSQRVAPKRSEKEDDPFYKALFGQQDVYPESEGRRVEEKSREEPASVSADMAESLRKAREEEARRQLLAMGYNPDTGEPVVSGGAAVVDPVQAPAASDQEGEGTAGAGGATGQESALGPRAVIKTSGGVSSLDDEWGTSESVGGLDQSGARLDENAAHPFRVEFASDGKIANGERVTLRLLEEMVVDGVKIRENTPLSGICTVTGNRLAVSVPALKVGNKIYTLNLKGYDTDGLEGLYCPQTNLGRSVKDGAQQAGSIIENALSSGIAGYAGRVVSAGASIIRSNSGNVTISVSSGYQFYLMADVRK